MKASRTALGVAPGQQQANFVFGDLAKTTGVPFTLAADLYQIESIAQQHIDFIQKLYFEQSVLGEYFEEIHLGTLVEPLSPPSGGPLLQVLLAERLKQWIAVDQLNLVLTQHTGISIKSQSRYLTVNNALPESLADDRSGMTDAFTIWSFIFAEASDVDKRRVFKKYQAVSYADMSRGIADHYLDRYKNDTIASFSETKFEDDVIEKERQRLLALANISQSGKHELLLCRERILNLLERQSAQPARVPETALAGDAASGEPETPLLDPEPPAQAKPAPPERQGQGPQQSSAMPVNDIFKSPQFAISDNLPAPESGGKTWREPNARKKIRVDAWLFRIVMVVVLAGLLWLALGA